MTQPSQCDRIADVLRDGRPHRMEEIHERVGFCRLNSRVAELRTRGLEIVCDKSGGVYTYLLVGGLKERAGSDPDALSSSPLPQRTENGSSESRTSGSSVRSGSGAAAVPPQKPGTEAAPSPALPTAQLSLLAAA